MKKITKFLDSVMGGIKRTCIAKALAVFAVASIAINANAQTGVITGVDQLEGKTQDYLFTHNIEFTTDANLKFPTEIDKHFFLYNVKTGRFLNVGGYWGTRASLKEYGEPLAIVNATYKDETGQDKTSMKLVMEMTGTEGKFVGWCGVPNTNDPDVGVFVDRKSTDVVGWQLELVDATKNTYRLYTYPHKTFNDKKIEWNFDKKYYLCSNMGSVDVDVNCGAYSEDDIANYKGYDEWRFLSYQQIHELQEENADVLDDALELSFKLKCPGFSRGDNDITNWNTYNYAIEYKTFGNWVISDPKNNTDNEFARYGLQYYYNNKIAGTKTENKFTGGTLPSGGYTFNGKTYTEIGKDFHRDLSKYYCASITNKRGLVYQDVVVTTAGRYQIECKGYSTTKKASLFAGVLNSDNKTMIGKAKKITLNQVSNMSQDAQKALHVSEKNVDYAGKNFYGSRQYINTVYVTVPEDVINKDGEATIRFGIMVGDDQNDKTPVTTGKGEWTVFDDFRILYAAKKVDEDLILDENRDNLSYLVNCPTPMVNKTLHLNKTFTLDKWNSFILPVNLNKKQVLETFGANARLAKLTRLTDTGIEFTSVDLLDDDSKAAIEAYVPYIIFPRKKAEQTEAYTASYEQKNQTDALKINIPANHYVIGKVSMPSTELSKMDQTKWTLKDPVGDDDIKAYGTFARTFGKFSSYDETTGVYGEVTVKGMEENPIIDGRDNLVDCYFFDKGNMYHSATRPRGLCGFSCWFKTTGTKTLRLTIDGVSQGTTGIEDILADYEQPVSRFANGIYNLNGQLVKQGNSTVGLPSGMYIVNGKKCIVR